MGTSVLDLDVRGATRSDQAQILDINMLAFDRPWDVELVELAMDPRSEFGQRLRCLAAVPSARPREVLGYCWWASNHGGRSKHGHVYSLAVHPSCWRRGVGQELLGKALGMMRRGGCASVSAAVGEGCLPAQQLLKALGLECIRTRERHPDSVSAWIALQDMNVPDGELVLWFSRSLK